MWTVYRSAELWHESVDGRPNTWRDVDGFHAICLKRPGDPLDPSTLVAAVSGWFFRTVMFRADCLGKLAVHSNLGHHRAPRPVDLDFVSRDEHRVLIAGAFSYQDAVAQVGNVLETLSEK